MIKEIAFTAFRVTDVAAARHFYEDILGLKLTTNYHEKWLEYELGEGTFVIETMSEDAPSGHRGMVAFEVDDMAAALAPIKAANIPIKMENMESPVCTMSFVTDPDGNDICIHKRKTAAEKAAAA